MKRYSKKSKLTRYGEEIKLTDELMENIGSYMDDNIRERLHSKLAPCENMEFLIAYLRKDHSFENLLYSDFGIEIE